MGNTIRQKRFWKDKAKQDHDNTIPKDKGTHGFEGKDGKTYIFLRPEAYIEVREFSNLSVEHQTVKFRGKLTIKFQSLPQEVKGCIKEKLKINLLQNQKTVLLDQTTAKMKIRNQGVIMLSYEIDEIVNWKPNFKFFPFDSHCVSIGAELAHLHIGFNRYYFHFGSEDNPKVHYFLFGSQELEDFLLFSHQIQYENIRRSIGNKRLQFSPRINLCFNLSRRPWYPSSFTVLLQIFILQLLSITMFFTPNDFGERVTMLTTLILAIMAFLVAFHANIPSITLADLMIDVAIINVGLCMLDTTSGKKVENVGLCTLNKTLGKKVVNVELCTLDNNPDPENGVLFILACCLVFASTLVSVVGLAWKAGEWFFVRWKKRKEKKTTEKQIQAYIGELIKAERDGRQMPADLKEIEVVQVGRDTAIATTMENGASAKSKKIGSEWRALCRSQSASSIRNCKRGHMV